MHFTLILNVLLCEADKGQELYADSAYIGQQKTLDKHEVKNQICKKKGARNSIGKAMAYSLKLWGRLSRYTQNGSWYIDNNLVENSIWLVALGRKNYRNVGPALCRVS